MAMPYAALAGKLLLHRRLFTADEAYSHGQRGCCSCPADGVHGYYVGNVSHVHYKQRAFANSCRSSETVATTALLGYNVYRSYINPSATPKQLKRFSEYSAVGFAIVAASIACGFNHAGFSVGPPHHGRRYLRRLGNCSLSLHHHVEEAVKGGCHHIPGAQLLCCDDCMVPEGPPRVWPDHRRVALWQSSTRRWQHDVALWAATADALDHIHQARQL